jgi:hypothetical protein
MTTPGPENDQYLLAGAIAARWLAAHHAEDASASEMFHRLQSDQRGFGLAFGSLAEMFLGVLEKLDRDGAIEGGVQLWLDRQALNFGAAADGVVERYRGAEGGNDD